MADCVDPRCALAFVAKRCKRQTVAFVLLFFVVLVVFAFGEMAGDEGSRYALAVSSASAANDRLSLSCACLVLLSSPLLVLRNRALALRARG